MATRLAGLMAWTTLVAILAVATGTAQAQSGSITGTVTRSSGGTAIVNMPVVALNPATMMQVGGVGFTNAVGQYTIANVPAGSVYVRTAGSPGINFIDEIYDNSQCPPCSSPTAVTVTSGGTTTGINFALAAGGGISGTVRDVNTLAGLSNVTIQVFDGDGNLINFRATVAGGTYSVLGLPSGTYFVRTTSSLNYVDQLWNSIPCTPCILQQGAPVVVTAGGPTQSNINFNLVPGGSVTGTVRNAALAPLSSIQVQVFAATGGALLKSTGTNGSGVYTLTGLPAASFYVRTAAAASQNYVDEIYDNVVAAGRLPTAGTPVPVTVGATTPGIDFTLDAGATINGMITNQANAAPIAGVGVEVLTAQGQSVKFGATNASGLYSIANLPAGSYLVRTSNTLGFADELFDNIPHSGGSVLGGTLVPVTAGGTATRNFALATGGTIAGTVSNSAPGGPVPEVGIQVLNAAGIEVRWTEPAPDGTYSVNGLPTGTYYVRTQNDNGYIDVLYNGLPAYPLGNNTLGTPISVTAGATTGAIDLVLTAGGRIAGRLTQTGTGTAIASASVGIFSSSGGLVTAGFTDSSGNYLAEGALAPGTYYAMAIVAGYVTQIYSGLPMCLPDCHPVTAGTPIAVTAGNTTGSIDLALTPITEMIQNGGFSNGLANWVRFATPDASYMTSEVNTSGAFSFSRVPPPPGTANQAVVYQNTGVAVPAGTNLVATFLLGNTAPTRKRVSVLIQDSDFSDLSVCTFWLPPLGDEMIPYVIRTRTTKAWANATIAFYAASTASPAGTYLLDDVSMQLMPGPLVPRTDCVDLMIGPAPGGPDGADLIVNGTFGTGTLPPWGTFGQIQSQISGGVFEFIKLAGTPSGVVLQPTSQAFSAGQVITATFQLGNSSGVRKRVTAILHDNDFSDLSACTLWLEPGQALSTYTYRTYATKAWANATLSIYPATTGADQWIRLDNVTLRATPSAIIAGTECIEPGGELFTAGAARANPAATGRGGTGPDAGAASRTSTAAPSEWTALQVGTSRVLQRSEAVDLTRASAAKLQLRSWLAGTTKRGAIQVSTDGVEWITVQTVGPSDRWSSVEIDLRDFLGEKVLVRFVLDTAWDAEGAALWRLGPVAIEVSRK